MARKRRDKPNRQPTVELEREPPARQRFDAMQTFTIVARNVVPLAGVLLFRGSVENFLVLCVFNIALDIACIAVVGLAVSARQIHGDKGAADAIGALVFLVVVGAVATLALTAMFGWVLFLIASESELGFLNAPLGWSALAIVLLALPGMVRQYREDMAAKRSEEERKRRDQPVVGGHLFSAVMILFLSGYAASLQRFGLFAFAILITAMFIARDLRPDVFRKLIPPPIDRPPR